MKTSVLWNPSNSRWGKNLRKVLLSKLLTLCSWFYNMWLYCGCNFEQALEIIEHWIEHLSSIPCIDIRFAAYLDVLAGVIGKDFTRKNLSPCLKTLFWGTSLFHPPLVTYPVVSSSVIVHCILLTLWICYNHEIIILVSIGQYLHFCKSIYLFTTWFWWPYWKRAYV